MRCDGAHEKVSTTFKAYTCSQRIIMLIPHSEQLSEIFITCHLSIYFILLLKKTKDPKITNMSHLQMDCFCG